jgi:hypothetical protein
MVKDRATLDINDGGVLTYHHLTVKGPTINVSGKLVMMTNGGVLNGDVLNIAGSTPGAGLGTVTFPFNSNGIVTLNKLICSGGRIEWSLDTNNTNNGGLPIINVQSIDLVGSVSITLPGETTFSPFLSSSSPSLQLIPVIVIS